jgi:hypothetical protein
LVLLTEDIYEYAVQMASCGIIYIPRFMKIGTSVQAILRCWLRNSNGCDVGVTDGIMKRPLRWAKVACYTYQVS